jgi:hypothetical protein
MYQIKLQTDKHNKHNFILGEGIILDDGTTHVGQQHRDVWINGEGKTKSTLKTN